jgi:hypothetical protein
MTLGPSDSYYIFSWRSHRSVRCFGSGLEAICTSFISESFIDGLPSLPKIELPTENLNSTMNLNAQQCRKQRRQARGEINKGGRPGWATPQQEAWLKERLSEYTEAQRSGKRDMAGFWHSAWADWFNSWPEPDNNQGLVKA